MSRGTRIEEYEKENGNRLLSSWQNGIPPRWEKRAKGELPNNETEKGIPQYIPKKVTNQGLSKESKLKEGKNEKNRKKNLPSDRHGTSSVNHKTKQRNQWFPGDARTSL